MAKVYRSVVATRHEAAQVLAPSRCDHIHHGESAARKCLVTRLREVLRREPLEVSGKIVYSHSRHDWFDVQPEKTEVKR